MQWFFQYQIKCFLQLWVWLLGFLGTMVENWHNVKMDMKIPGAQWSPECITCIAKQRGGQKVIDSNSDKKQGEILGYNPSNLGSGLQNQYKNLANSKQKWKAERSLLLKHVSFVFLLGGKFQFLCIWNNAVTCLSRLCLMSLKTEDFSSLTKTQLRV